jgi:hypothetical protein
LPSRRALVRRTVLNGWDNSVEDGVQMRATQRAMLDRLRLLLDEDERAKRISVRSTAEKTRLRARRLFGIVLSIGYTVLAWAIILTFQVADARRRRRRRRARI